MRVAYLLPDPGIPVGGVKGASVHVAEVCRALVMAGARVQLYAMRANGDPPEGVELVLFDTPAIPSGALGELARRRAVHDFLAWAEPRVAASGVDLLYERLSLFAGTGGEMAARLAGRRVVEVNAPVAAERARQVGLALHADAAAAERRALHGARAIAVSRPMAAWCRDRGAVSVQVTPNGVDGERFSPERNAADAASIRADLAADRSELVGFVGSMKPWHGVATLLEAVARLAPRRPRLRLLVVGDGPGLSHMRARASRADLLHRCHLVGAVPSAEVPAYLAALDVAVAPYLDPGLGEGFYFSPLKVVEAMAAARPVVASRFEPIEAMLGGTGLLVPAGDVDALARALTALLDDPDAACGMGIAARRRAMAHFSWHAVAQGILADEPKQSGLAESVAGGSHVAHG